MKYLSVILAVLTLLAVPASAQLTNEKMMKIVMRDTTPGIPDSAFIKKPKTLYRMGRTYGRIEEMPDRREGVHGLMVVAEPKAWMINLADSSGKLIIDPGPTFDFRASIARADFKKQVQPLKDFEFGTEYNFLKLNKADSGIEMVAGKNYDKLQLTIEGYTIVLLSQMGKQQPFRVTITKGAEIDCQYDYDEYQIGLAPDMKLFEPPSWVKIGAAGKQ